MSNKLKNARKVTVLEDWKNKKGRVILKKGSTHAMHVRTASALKQRGAKINIEDINAKAIQAKAKAQLAENNKKEVENNYK